MPFDRRSGALPCRFEEMEITIAHHTQFGFMYFINQSMNESINQTEQNLYTNNKSEKARWPSGKASDSRAKGRESILTERAMLCP